VRPPPPPSTRNTQQTDDDENSEVTLHASNSAITSGRSRHSGSTLRRLERLEAWFNMRGINAFPDGESAASGSTTETIREKMDRLTRAQERIVELGVEPRTGQAQKRIAPDTQGVREDTHTNSPSNDEHAQAHDTSTSAGGSLDTAGEGAQLQGRGSLDRGSRDLRGLTTTGGGVERQDLNLGSVKRREQRIDLGLDPLGAH
jgi:hypothetical protein